MSGVVLRKSLQSGNNTNNNNNNNCCASYHYGNNNSYLSNHNNNNNNNVSCKPPLGSKSKVSPTRRLTNLLKPLLGRVFKTRAKQLQKRNSYIAASPLAEREAEFEWLTNEMDNRANEHLEQRLVEELQMCAEDDAIVVYDEGGGQRLQTIDKQQYYVPVHFARTNAGTFFWTSLQRQPLEPYNIEWNFMDRWAQA